MLTTETAKAPQCFLSLQELELLRFLTRHTLSNAASYLTHPKRISSFLIRLPSYTSKHPSIVNRGRRAATGAGMRRTAGHLARCVR